MMKIKYYFKKACIRLFEYTRFNKILRIVSDWYEVTYNTPGLVSNPPLSGWSIIIITDGNNSDSLDQCITSAEKELSTSPYEIIVVGPPWLKINLSHSIKHITHLPYKELLLWSVPGFISRKKNLGAMAAKYDKLVITHDYIVFSPGWKKGFDEFGDFTVCVNIMQNKDGSRHRDWMVWDYPEITQALLPYEYSFNQYQYINGAYFVVQRDFFSANPIDEKLRWGEGEDVDWSKKIRDKVKISLNTQSVISYSKQKPTMSKRWTDNTQKLENILRT